MSLLTANVGAGDLKYKITGEGGVARASSRVNDAENFLPTGIEGQLKLIHSDKKYGWYLQTDVQPEIFFQSFNITALNWTANGQYLQKYRRFNWSIKSDYRMNRVSVNAFDLNYNVILAGVHANWYFKPGASLAFSAEFASRNLDAGLKNQLQAYILSAKWRRFLTLSTKFSAGIFAENFYIDGSGTDSGVRENNGWRLGPEVALDYKKRFVLNARYRLISHRSQLIDDPVLEHWMRFVFGKILSSRWSLFLLADFYIRNSSNQPEVNPNLLYTPLSNQNRFYVKLDQEFSRQVDIFLKIGYINEDLVYDGLTFSGWRGTIGLEIRN